MKLWQPWIEETKAAVNRYARWVFAALVLNFLVLANVAAVFVILNQLKKMIG